MSDFRIIATICAFWIVVVGLLVAFQGGCGNIPGQ